MKTFVAVLMGLISGIVIYMMVGLLTVDMASGSAPSPVLVLVTLIGGWVLSTWLLLRQVRSVSGVFRRGFLLGAAEWLMMAVVGVIFSGRATSTAIAQSGGSNAESAGAAIGGGLAAIMTGGLSIAMAVVCLIGFAIAYFMGREMKDQTITPTRKCPECAEMIQADARKCRFCGASFGPATTPA